MRQHPVDMRFGQGAQGSRHQQENRGPGADVVGNTAAEFGAALRAESAQWAEITKREHPRRMKIFILDPIHPRARLRVEALRNPALGRSRACSSGREADALMVRMTPVRAADMGARRSCAFIRQQGVGYDTSMSSRRRSTASWCAAHRA